MRYRLLAALPLLAATFTQMPAAPERGDEMTLTIFDFGEGDASRWGVVNDGVMGGRSQGFGQIEGGTMTFEGTLVTRGGGFTSVRTSRRADLGGYDGLELRVRGGGRTFEVEVDDGTRRGWRQVSRRAPFPTTVAWTWVRVPFDDLRTTVFGRSVSAPDLDRSSIRGFGIYIADGKNGPFRLEVDEIRAYRD
jgi:hypothetical protein